jgi:diadenosine tetraphosphate (Ap4A) HIT family hydrolase
MDLPCPLCSAAEGREILSANVYAMAIWGAFPVSPGHALIVSRRHVANLFELSAEEQAALWALLPAVKTAIGARCVAEGGCARGLARA